MTGAGRARESRGNGIKLTSLEHLDSLSITRINTTTRIMSFAELASGASCGPGNGMQQLGKRFGVDRSAQQDRYAGPSSGEARGVSTPSRCFD